VATVHHGLTRSGVAAPVQRWSVPTHIDLREWDGEFVARCDASSATYLLSALAGESLRALQAGATSAQQIVARVFDTESPPPEGTTAALAWKFGGRDTEVERVLAVLHELETLGIARAHAG
jgi:hypothetical protein